MDPESWQRGLEGTTQSATAPLGDVELPGLYGLTVLAHPDLRRIGEVAPLTGLLAGRGENLSRLEPLFAPPRRGSPRPLADNRLSRSPLVISGTPDGGITLDRSRLRTAVELDGHPLEGATVDLAPERLKAGAVLLLARRVALVLHPLEAATCEAPGYSLVGESAAIRRVRQEIRRVADLPFPVLLRGESGTGKELVARAIHGAGPRRVGPYLAVNLGAIPANLAAAELFGASKGAFTGADRSRRGHFQRAAGGSLFLDEIGEAAPEIQTLLLRTLDTGEVQPVGGSPPSPAQVRWIAATDADLETLSASGEFKAPLLHRLSGYEIRLPPLRERREDVGRLFVHFLERESEVLDRPGESAVARSAIAARALCRLALFPWPGNVRQLRNVVRRMVVASRGSVDLRFPESVEELLAAAAATTDTPGVGPPRVRYRDADEVGREELRDTLRLSRWNLSRTARRLGISRGALYERLSRDPQLRKASDLGREELQACLESCGGDLETMVDRLQVSKRGLKLRLTELGLRRPPARPDPPGSDGR